MNLILGPLRSDDLAAEEAIRRVVEEVQRWSGGKEEDVNEGGCEANGGRQSDSTQRSTIIVRPIHGGGLCF